MKKKTPRKKLIAELDALFSERIRQRDKKCFLCGSEKIQTHHIFGRKNMSVRWLPDNGIGICWPQHRNLAHGDPLKFRQYLIAAKGEAFLADLEREANKTVKFTIDDLILIKEKLLFETIPSL